MSGLVADNLSDFWRVWRLGDRDPTRCARAAPDRVPVPHYSGILRRRHMAAEVSKARIAAEAVQGGDAVFGTESNLSARGRNQPLAIRGVRSMTLLSIAKPGCERSGRAFRSRTPWPRRSVTVSEP